MNQEIDEPVRSGFIVASDIAPYAEQILTRLPGKAVLHLSIPAARAALASRFKSAPNCSSDSPV